jgi:hypothetical protein
MALIHKELEVLEEKQVQERRRLGGATTAQRSFVIQAVSRCTGFSAEVSTFDSCHIFNAVVSAPPPASMFSEKDGPGVESRLLTFHRQAFFRAKDTIDMDSSHPQFSKAVGEAKAFKSSIALAASALMHNNTVLTTRALHFNLLTDPSKKSVALESFWTSGRLHALAQHLVVALTAERVRSGMIRPLILSCALPRGSPGDREEYCVVLNHEGASRASRRPIAVIQHWEALLRSEFYQQELTRDGINRDWALMRGRESTSHFVEAMHLQSVSRR